MMRYVSKFFRGSMDRISKVQDAIKVVKNPPLLVSPPRTTEPKKKLEETREASK